MSDDNGCGFGKVTREMIASLKDSMARTEISVKEVQRVVTNELAHRLPPWATMVITLMALVIGYLVRAKKW